MSERILIVEAPESRATVDFLDCPEHAGVSVLLTLENGKLQIEVRTPVPSDCWNGHTFEVDIPVQTEQEEEEQTTKEQTAEDTPIAEEDPIAAIEAEGR